jgi:hypothetical protein
MATGRLRFEQSTNETLSSRAYLALLRRWWPTDRVGPRLMALGYGRGAAGVVPGSVQVADRRRCLKRLIAYFTSPCIKIGGKVVAFYMQDAQVDASAEGSAKSGRPGSGVDAPASTGGFTPAKESWWLVVPAMALCAFNVTESARRNDARSAPSVTESLP